MNTEKIYLLPMGFEDDPLLDAVSSAVNNAFGLPTDRLPAMPIPDYAFDQARGQYHSTAILKRLQTVLPGDALKLLGITDVDMFVPQLNFVFGEAAVDGRVSVISLYRLRPEFYGEPPDRRLFVERAAKEAIHELGHTFGLRHCQNPDCIMFFSNNIQDTDRKQAEFCGESARELHRKLQTLKQAA